MDEVRLIPVKGLPLVSQGDNLAEMIVDHSSVEIEDGDVLVIAQKIVSKAEGAVVDLNTITASPEAEEISKQTGRDARLVQVYLDEATEVIRIKGRMVITRHKLGFKMSSSGVDKSNVAPKDKMIVVLLPKDPDASCRRLRDDIKASTGKNVAVIMNDSLGRDDRDGSIGLAIGIAGISHLDFRKQTDLFGNEANSRIALIDELAAAGSILMGQANESVPAVIIRGVPFLKDEEASIKKILNL